MRIFLPLVLLTAGACAEPEGLRVNGSASLELEGSQSGFFFSDTTFLVEGEPMIGDSRIGGTCVLPPMGGLASLTLARSGMGEGIAVSSLEIEVGQSALGEAEGRVEVTTAAATFIGVDGMGECRIDESYRDLADGYIGVDIDCKVRDASNREASLVAELHYAGCANQ
jgi:hypothetical protein